MSRLTGGLVICTKDRAEDLRSCLEAVGRCSPLPDEIVVVDSSTGPEAREVTALARRTLGERLRYVAASPGLTHQRNVGVQECHRDVIHFIDDDAEPEPGYFAALMQVFEDLPQAVGASGHIANFVPLPRGGRTERLLHLEGPDGQVLPSGRNLRWRFEPPERALTHWLSGCSMSYRRWVLLEERFDESLTGYALGEDVDLSVRVGQHGILVHEPAARILHHESPRGRWAIGRMVRVEVKHRHDRVLTGLEGQRRSAFWVSVAGQVGLSAARGVTRLSRWQLSLAWWTLRGAVDVLASSGSTPRRP